MPEGSHRGSADFDCLGGASSRTWRLLLLTASKYDLLFSLGSPAGGGGTLVKGVGFMLGLLVMSAGVLVKDPVMEWMEGEEVTSGENFIGDVGGVATADVSFLEQNNFKYLLEFRQNDLMS